MLNSPKLSSQKGLIYNAQYEHDLKVNELQEDQRLFSNLIHETTNNPTNVSIIKDNATIDDFSVDKNNLKEAVTKELGADKIMFTTDNSSMSNVKDNDSYLNKNKEYTDENIFLTLYNDNFVNFNGIRGDSKINGSVYFTGDSMVIVVENENATKDKIIVPVD